MLKEGETAPPFSSRPTTAAKFPRGLCGKHVALYFIQGKHAGMHDEAIEFRK